jgi:flagellar FliL protein
MTIFKKSYEFKAFAELKQLSVVRLLKGLLLATAAIYLLTIPKISHAQDDAQKPTYAYVGLEPDIVTNYAGDNSKKLGYVRVTIEMMVADPSKIMSIEHHMPLLRATAIEVFGAQPEDKIRSLTGREDIRRLVLQKFRDIMKRETGEDVIENIIFTKYLRQGG